MPGNVKDRLKAGAARLHLKELELLARTVLEAAAGVEARKTPGKAPSRVDDRTVTEVAMLLQGKAAPHDPTGLIGLASRDIGTIDFETVFSALSLASAEAQRESVAMGRPVTGQ